MATAVMYGLLASSSFVVGVVLGLATKLPRRLLAVVIAFAPGCWSRPSPSTSWARRSNARPGLRHYRLPGRRGHLCAGRCRAGSAWPPVPQRTGRDPQDVVPGRRQLESTEVAATTGLALLVGALIDGIPESAAIGLSLHAEGRDLGIVLLAAVFLANVPESLGSVAAMRQEGAPAATSSGSGPRWRSPVCWPWPATRCWPVCRRAGSARSWPWRPGGSWPCWPTRCFPRPSSMAAGGWRWPPPSGSPVPSCSANLPIGLTAGAVSRLL